MSPHLLSNYALISTLYCVPLTTQQMSPHLLSNDALISWLHLYHWVLNRCHHICWRIIYKLGHYIDTIDCSIDISTPNGLIRRVSLRSKQRFKMFFDFPLTGWEKRQKLAFLLLLERISIFSRADNSQSRHDLYLCVALEATHRTNTLGAYLGCKVWIAERADPISLSSCSLWDVWYSQFTS
jgi:hypothetical protein